MFLCPRGFLKQEYWKVLPFPSAGDLPDPGMERLSLSFPASAGQSLLLSYLGGPGAAREVALNVFLRNFFVNEVLYFFNLGYSVEY